MEDYRKCLMFTNLSLPEEHKMRESWEQDLNRHLSEQSAGDELENLTESMMHQAVHDAALFCTYDDDFEVIDRDQVMRCLKNLDSSIVLFNRICDIVNENGGDSTFARRPIDAIFTALSIMQKNLQKAVEHEAQKAIDSRNEAKLCGGEE